MGDWTADEYLYSRGVGLERINGDKHVYMEKNEFIRTFGYPNDNKGGRFDGRAARARTTCGTSAASARDCPQSHNLYVVYRTGGTGA